MGQVFCDELANFRINPGRNFDDGLVGRLKGSFIFRDSFFLSLRLVGLDHLIDSGFIAAWRVSFFTHERFRRRRRFDANNGFPLSS